MEFLAEINLAFQSNGINLSTQEAILFSKLTEEMLRVNSSMNLTAITDPLQIAIKHYADCASVANLPPKNATVADIGAGGGFPTLPLAILRPDLKILAVDSTEKRMRYVDSCANMLERSNVSVLTARAEEMGKKPAYRESFDFVTARAVAPLNILCELCLPLVKVGGYFCALKAVGGKDELEQAKQAAATLGGTATELKEFALKDPSGKTAEDALKRMIILIQKTTPTPEKYPRRFARIQSDPL